MDKDKEIKRLRNKLRAVEEVLSSTISMDSWDISEQMCDELDLSKEARLYLKRNFKNFWKED